MPLTSGQVLPIASVRVYDEGQQDPIVVDHGFSWLDIFQESAGFGTYELDANYRPKLEFLDGIGLACRPTLNLKDTRLASYVTSGGAWEERRPATGSPRVYRLVQLDTSNAVQWSATSNFTIPKWVDFAISLVLPDTPPDWDAATYEPYVRVTFGGGWGILLTKSAAHFVKLNGANYEVVGQIPLPSRGQGYTDLEEIVFYIRGARDQIGISSDLGQSYDWYAPSTGAVAQMAAGPITVTGQGGMCIFGLHQLAYAVGYYLSPKKDTFTTRPLVAPSFAVTAHRPGPTLAELADVSENSRRYARYRLTLTPRTVAAVPFTFHQSPSAQSVWMRWSPVIVNGSGAYTTPWDTRVREISISKPPDLSQGTATIIIERDRGSTWPGAVGSLRDRKMQIRAGYQRGVDEFWWTVFTGYVVNVQPYSRGGRFFVRLTLNNATHTFRSTHWTSQDIRSLGAQSLNSANDWILASEGLNASYRSWHARGDNLQFPAGLAEEPFELIRPRECKWETLVRLNRYAGLEVAAMDDATFATVPFEYVTGITHTYEALPETNDLYTIAEEVTAEWDYEQAVTAIMISGRGVNGAELTAWARDLWAETSTASGRFAPRRHVLEEEIQGTVTPGILLALCGSLATRHFPIRTEPPIAMPLNLGIGRRDKLILNGAGTLGIPDGTDYVVLGLQHEIRCNDDGSSQMATAGMLWEVI